jgi:hypothetical protein
MKIAGFEVLSAEQYFQMNCWRVSLKTVTDLELPLLAELARRGELREPSLLYNLRDELDLVLRVLNEEEDPAVHQLVVNARVRLDREFKKRKMDPDGLSNNEPISPADGQFMVGYIGGGAYKTVHECEWALRFAARILRRVKDARERSRIGDGLEALGMHMLAIEYGQKKERPQLIRRKRKK